LLQLPYLLSELASEELLSTRDKKNLVKLFRNVFDVTLLGWFLLQLYLSTASMKSVADAVSHIFQVDI